MKKYAWADDIGFEFAVPRGARLMDVLVGLDMSPSNKDAKSLIRSGGVRVNGVRVTDPLALAEEGIVTVGSGVGLVATGMAAKKYMIRLSENAERSP